MLKKRLVQTLTAILQGAILVSLFLPAVQDYERFQSIWERTRFAFQIQNTADIFTNCLYFIPIIIALLLVILLESKFRYAVSLLAAGMGITLTLSQFIFPALSQNYLFSVYQPGLYLLLLFQSLTILTSIAGICLKQTPEELLQNSATAELDLKKINKHLRRQRKKEQKKAAK